MGPIKALWSCETCSYVTSHTLTPAQGGAGRCCSVCGHVGTITHAEMLRLLTSWTQGMHPPPPSVPDTEGVRVFIRLPEGEESELAPRFVREHAEITGALPEAGKPLYARVAGLPIPYGEVVRVITPNP